MNGMMGASDHGKKIPEGIEGKPVSWKNRLRSHIGIRKAWSALIGRDGRFSRGAAAGLFVFAAPASALIASGTPTGWGALHYAAAVLLGEMLLAVSTIVSAAVLAVLFSLLRLRLPRWFPGCAASFFGWFAYALTHFSLGTPGAVAVAGAVTVLGTATGSAVALVTDKSRTGRLRRWLSTGYLAASLAATAGAVLWWFSPGTPVYPPEGTVLNQRLPAPLTADNPGEPGPYTIQYLTYGSGTDRHREEFAEQADLISPTADASSFVSGWREPRTWFWGFDESALPLNGRVWMPEGKGPFPLVLIVHGNAHMEEFSDTGYEYLGELLASRGMIAVSVDENFLNYSTWSGALDEDMTARAWLLLKHLEFLREADGRPGHPLSGKIDFERIALVGHSRGGQAAALAAVFHDFFGGSRKVPTSPELRFSIRSVVAVAPTDKLVDSRRVPLRGVNYFALQGSMDGDVNVFYGDRQYRRTDVSGPGKLFKASLYVQGANHGQFNTEWGEADLTAPTHWLMNKGDLLDAEEQRQIAKVFIGAFLEATLHDRDEYVGIFRDYRRALDWLPTAPVYVSRYEDGTFAMISRHEDRDKRTLRVSGATARAYGMDVWEEETVTDRLGNSTGNRAVRLSWNGEQEAVYEIRLPKGYAAKGGWSLSHALSFSLANLPVEDGAAGRPLVKVELETDSGAKVRLPLDWFMPVPPVIHSQFAKTEFFEEEVREGRFGEEAEPVFQTFELPFSVFHEMNPKWRPERVRVIRFVFSPSVPGQVYLDTIGVIEAAP